MAQLTIYLDNSTLKKIEAAATEESISVSKWVRQRLEQALTHEWPSSYFSLFGALKDVDFQEAGEINFQSNIQREEL